MVDERVHRAEFAGNPVGTRSWRSSSSPIVELSAMTRTLKVALALILLCQTHLWAHPLDEATLQIDLAENQAKVVMRLPGEGLKFADDNGDGLIHIEEIRAHRRELKKELRERFQLLGDGVPGRIVLVPAGDVPSQSHIELALQVQWHRPPSELDIHFSKFDWSYEDPPSCLGTLVGGGFAESFIFDQEHTEFKVAHEASVTSVGSFVKLGLKHILEGYDHLLFVLTLLLAGGGLWEVFKMVTSFTVAHSLTLGLAVLGYINLPGFIVEPIIALSIVYAAAENWRQPEPEKRWILAGAFGLIHGLGFAGILADLNLSGVGALKPLLGFNLGVEIGQILVVVLLYPVLSAVVNTKNWRKIQLGGSAICAAVGLYWVVQRVFG